MNRVNCRTKAELNLFVTFAEFCIEIASLLRKICYYLIIILLLFIIIII